MSSTNQIFQSKRCFIEHIYENMFFFRLYKPYHLIILDASIDYSIHHQISV